MRLSLRLMSHATRPTLSISCCTRMVPSCIAARASGSRPLSVPLLMLLDSVSFCCRACRAAKYMLAMSARMALWCRGGR